MPLTTVGVDIGKNVIQLHYIDAETGELINKPIKRTLFLEHFADRALMPERNGSLRWLATLGA